MNMRGFGLTFQSSFEHLLRGYILAAVELDNAAIVKRISITWQNTFGPEAGFRDREIRPRAGCDFRYLGVFVDEYAKLVSRLSKPTSNKLLVRTLERDKSRRLILRRWSRRRRSWCGSNGSNRSLLLRRFDP